MCNLSKCVREDGIAEGFKGRVEEVYGFNGETAIKQLEKQNILRNALKKMESCWWRISRKIK